MQYGDSSAFAAECRTCTAYLIGLAVVAAFAVATVKGLVRLGEESAGLAAPFLVASSHAAQPRSDAPCARSR